jgi:hypothetical protein
MAGLSDIINFIREKFSSDDREETEVIEESSPSGLTELVLRSAQERGVGSGKEDSNVSFLVDTIGQLESKNNPLAEYQGPESSAKGEFQWLTNDAKGQPSIVTALNRAERYFNKANLPVPSWITDAKKHRNPTLLNRQQQKELFLADIFERKNSDSYLKNILASRDRQALKDLYMNVWHTKPSRRLSTYVDGVLFPAAGLEEPLGMASYEVEDEVITAAAKGGRVERDPYNNYNTQRTI